MAELDLALPLPDTALGPEWAALELCCRGVRTQEERGYFEELLRTPGFDVGELLWQAMRHRLLPMLAQCTADSVFARILSSAVHFDLQLAWRGNVVRLAEARRRACAVAAVLSEAGIRFALTKGIVLESSLYDGAGTRWIGDVDVMISPSARDDVALLLQRMGLRYGRHDLGTNRIVPLDRATEIEFRLHPDHLPHLMMLTDSPLLPVFVVDVATSLTWHGATWQVPTDEALREVAMQPVPGQAPVRVPALLPVYSFLFIVLHFFREAWFERTIDFQQDVTLAKVADVVRAWRRWRPELGGLQHIIRDHDIADPLVWVLEHVDRTVGTRMVGDLGLTGRVNEAWLASGRASGGGALRWSVAMRERLQSKDRRQHVIRLGE